jgi:Lrp/AsnC family transcriptional regulator, leucine-responsive regulatory protein
VDLDAVDRGILEVLRGNARLSVSEIARRVGLSSAPVSRRIARMEQAGVIKGYVAVIDDQFVGGIDAFTEVRLLGTVDTSEIEAIARAVPEVIEVLTISGDPDALLRFRVENVDHLQRVVNAIRRSGKVSGTKTLIVMKSWSRGGEGRTEHGSD